MKIKKYSKGFSLLELLLVIGIILSLMVTAFIIYPKIKVSQDVSQDAQYIKTIAGGVRQLYSTRQDYEGLNDSVVINAKIAPDHLVKNGKVYLSNSKSMTFSEQHSNSGGYLYTYFFFNILGFSEEECKKNITNDPR